MSQDSKTRPEFNDAPSDDDETLSIQTIIERLKRRSLASAAASNKAAENGLPQPLDAVPSPAPAICLASRSIVRDDPSTQAYQTQVMPPDVAPIVVWRLHSRDEKSLALRRASDLRVHRPADGQVRAVVPARLAGRRGDRDRAKWPTERITLPRRRFPVMDGGVRSSVLRRTSACRATGVR